MALSVHKALPDVSKLEPLDGTNYRCWSQKLLIFFEQLKADYVLFPDLTEENNTSEITATSHDGIVKDKSETVNEETKKKFEKDNKTIKGYLLNCMTNPPIDLFVAFKSTKIISEKLEIKYRADDAGKKKYVVGEWLRFHITDDNPIVG